MNVILRPVGLLKAYCRGLLDDQGRIELPGCEGQTLARVCRDIGLPEGLVSLFIVNGQPQPDSYRLQPGDQVKCVALIGGG
jgi:sulfur carrier protein ThiS